MISHSTIANINSAARIEDVIQDFVKLKKKGKDFEALCPFHNENTPSFSVSPAKGIYKCFGCGVSGDSIKFLMEHEHKSYPDAVRWLADKYRIPVEEDYPAQPEKAEKKIYKKPVINPESTLTEKHLQWFQERAISEATVKKLNIRSGIDWMPDHNKEIDTVLFPYIRNGEVINIKYRGPKFLHRYKEKETGEEKTKWKKTFKLVSGAELIFFNLDSLKGHTEAIITEGEPDTAAYIEAGFVPVISIPNGGSTGEELAYLSNCKDEIKHIERWYISTDNDPTGIGLRDELIRRLGKDKCFVITLPEGIKDANDALKYYGPECLRKAKEEARRVPLDDVIYIKDIAADMLASFQTGQKTGTTTYFQRIDIHWKWKKGEVTLIHGRPNHGKSALIIQLMLVKSLREGDKWGIYSPENYPPTEFYNDIIHSMVGKSTDPAKREDQMSIAEYQDAMKFIGEHFFYIYPSGPSSPEAINEKFKELILTEGITGCLIDPYNQLDHDMSKHGRDDLYLSDFLAKEKRFALMHDVYKLIISHPKTMPKGNDVPDAYDLHGGSMWNNKCDNILAVHRPDPYNPHNQIVEFHSQKIKKQKLVGLPGKTDLEFKRSTNRYYEPGGFGPWMLDPVEVLKNEGKWQLPEEKRIQSIFNNMNQSPPDDSENKQLKFNKVWRGDAEEYREGDNLPF